MFHLLIRDDCYRDTYIYVPDRENDYFPKLFSCLVYLGVFSCFHYSNSLYRLQGKSQIVQNELARLGEQLVNSAEGTRAIALELCREFEEKFLLHLAGGEVSNFLHK